MFYFLWILAAIFLLWSLYKDRDKTEQALEKSWKAFINIFPDFAFILVLVGLAMTFLSPSTISALIGTKTGALGMAMTSVVGSITLIPGFVAFPLAKSLLDNGAGIAQIAVFISTLMMVGVVTAPLETRYFNKKETLVRNLLGFGFSFVVALVIGVVVA